MNIFVDLFRKSGTKDVCHVTGDERELRRMAERLRVEVKQDVRGLHLDITEHQRALAIRYGAKSATSYAKEINDD